MTQIIFQFKMEVTAGQPDLVERRQGRVDDRKLDADHSARQALLARVDLLPEVLSLRIVAYRTLGDMDQAGQALEALLTLAENGIKPELWIAGGLGGGGGYAGKLRRLADDPR